MIVNEHYSFAEECKRLYECNERENVAKGYSKYKKAWSWMQVKTKILLCTKQEWFDDDWSKKR